MREELISFETAKLAKEKGFYVMCEHGFTFNEDNDDIDERESWWLWMSDHYEKHLRETSGNLTVYGRPTQSLLQRWLREKHGVHGVVMPITTPNNPVIYYIYKGERKLNWENCFISYEEALETGLQEALKQIGS